MVAAFGVGHMSCAYRDVPVHPRQIQRVVCDPGIPLKRGDELGVFHLGSTVVLLTQRGLQPVLPELPVSVRMGQALFEGSDAT
jgi:phosphatidylserine decarboxylase